MNDPSLIFPVLIVFAGAMAATAAGLSQWRHRAGAPMLGWLLAVAPLSAFVLVALRLPALQANLVFTWQIDWIPAAGLRMTLYLDSLGTLFALLITFIGTLVTIYAGQYFKGTDGAWRFFAYLLLFTGAMLGLVMAGDVLTLFIFWEMTSIISFLLVAYKFKDDAARQGAFKALFITAGGGITLLVGLLLMAHVAGDTRFLTILESGDLLRNSSSYAAILVLIALGAFTKSAQFPFHIWLPDAMSAPTPASAYLHSATMVKAGIYLMARLNPVLGGTETWFWLLSCAGMITMLVGAVLGLKKFDLKAILAYSTICQLGILMMMIGQDVGSKSIVGAILTDFRGMDTLIEIAVFSIAGLGIFTLISIAAGKFADRLSSTAAPAGVQSQDGLLGIGGKKTSPLIRALARLALALAMTIGACDLLYGHDKPGDGFTAGVIVSIGIGFWYMAFGYDETRRRLSWLKPSALIGWGILMAILSGVGAWIVNGSFFSNTDWMHSSTGHCCSLARRPH